MPTILKTNLYLVKHGTRSTLLNTYTDDDARAERDAALLRKAGLNVVTRKYGQRV